MPNRTQLVYSDNPGAVPATYPVPPSMDLVLQSVVVKWDGSAAGSAFLPVLAVYSQDGQLVGRFHPGSQVEAGDTATVTYAPFLRAASTAGAAQISHLFAAAKQSAGKLIADSTVTDIAFGVEGHNGDGIAFQSAAGSRIKINIATGYYYTASFRVLWPSFAGDRYIEMTTTSPTLWSGMQLPVRARESVTPDGDSQTVSATLIPSGAGGFVTLTCNVFQQSGVGQTITEYGLSVVAHLLVETS